MDPASLALNSDCPGYGKWRVNVVHRLPIVYESYYLQVYTQKHIKKPAMIQNTHLYI